MIILIYTIGRGIHPLVGVGASFIMHGGGGGGGDRTLPVAWGTTTRLIRLDILGVKDEKILEKIGCPKSQ